MTEVKMKRLSRTILIIALLLFWTLRLGAAGDDPWKRLNGFQPVPNSLGRLDEGLVAGLLQNPEGQLALVIFHIDCRSDVCELSHAGYVIYNGQGDVLVLHTEPEDVELTHLFQGEHVRVL